VIISDEEIDYPKAMSVDLLLALTQAAADKYGHEVRPSGIVILDSSKVVTPPHGSFAVHPLPIIETAKESVGKTMVANIVSLGAIVGLLVVSASPSSGPSSRVPKGTEDLNRRALRPGSPWWAPPRPAGGVHVGNQPPAPL
jgi:2-oxoglutarate ferredoxin oxidoreductase subunit gamma